MTVRDMSGGLHRSVRREAQLAVLADGRRGQEPYLGRPAALAGDAEPVRDWLALAPGDRLARARHVGREARSRPGALARCVPNEYGRERTSAVCAYLSHYGIPDL